MFDCAEEYDRLLHQGVRLSGEDKQFFIRGRLQDLQRQLPEDFSPRRILDFGCGLGDTTKALSGLFPQAEVIGFDTSEAALRYARQNYGSAKISFCNLTGFAAITEMDLCYTNGVFHHIAPEERREAIAGIQRVLRQGGYFSLFENNPWNPGTRMVMRFVPFDRDARPLNPRVASRLVREGGFAKLYPARFLFYFPRFLARLRFLESRLACLPFGAQYHLLAQK